METKAILLLMQYWAFHYVTVLNKYHPLQRCWDFVFDKFSANGKYVRERSLVRATTDFNNLWKRTSTCENTPTVQDDKLLAENCPIDFDLDDKFLDTLYNLPHTSIFAVRKKVNAIKRLYDEDNSEYMRKRALLLLMQYWAIRSIMALSVLRSKPEQLCWQKVLGDNSNNQWLRERARKFAHSTFRRDFCATPSNSSDLI